MSSGLASKRGLFATLAAGLLGLLALRACPHETAQPGPRGAPVASSASDTAVVPEPSTPARSELRFEVSAAGRAVPGAAVALWSLGVGTKPLVGQTSSRGDVEFPALVPGRYGYSVEHAEFVRYAGFVELRGARLLVEVLLQRGATVAGSVVSARGLAIAAASVQVFAGDGAELVKEATSASDGSFVLTGLPLKALQISARAHPHRPVRSEVRFERHGEQKTLTLALEEGFIVAGRVVDSRSAPVPGAQVGSNEATSGFVVTDERGAFELGGLSGAPVNVFATAPGFPAAHRQNVQAGTRGIELVLQPPATVHGAFALPPEATRVDVALCHLDEGFERELCVARRIFRAPAATYVLDRLPAGVYELVFEVEGRPVQRFPVELASGRELEGPSVSW